MNEHDKDEIVRPFRDLEPEAQRTIGYLGAGFGFAGVAIYLVFALLYDPWDAIITFGTFSCIAVVALILHGLQAIQFSLKTILLAILTLQLPMGLLLTSKTRFLTNLGIVALLVWIAGVVTYVLVGKKREAK